MFGTSMQVFFFTLCSAFVASLSPHPKLILISFDGFRYDLLNETMTPNIHRWALRSTWFVNGSRSQYVTYTAPNHMSIVTGLHEVDHGIVSNYFFDTATGKLFDYFNFTGKQGIINASLDMSWYKGEPIWLTNEKSDSSRRSASLYWPNGDAPFPTPPHRPSIYKTWTTYGNLSEWMTDADAIVGLFMKEVDPVNFVAWYIAEPDHILHTNGFYNGELRKKIQELDQLFGYFVAKFHDTGLENSVNVILTADHGHAQIKGVENIMCVRDYIASDGYDIGDHMIYPHNQHLARELYNNITNAARTFGYKVNVFLKEDIPARLFYSNSTRIGRIVIEPHVGWAASLSCSKKKLLDTYASGKVKYNSSTHGMDPDRKEMRAILVIGGPSIASGKKVMEVPNNIDLYSLMCYLLSVSAAPNNSSMSIIEKAFPQQDSQRTAEISDSVAFIILLVISSCIIVVFVIYTCRYTKVNEQLIWAWNQKGYRPLHPDFCGVEQGKHISDSIFSMRKDTSRDGWSEDEF